MGRVENKVIIVTGGASGIGQASSILLANEGAKVAIVDINQEQGQATVDLIKSQGNEAYFWHLDVCHEQSVSKTFAAIAAKFGRIDVLVNNIGIIGDNKPTHELLEAEWDKVMNVNVKSVFFCTKHAVPYLKNAGGGSIINLSSLHGLMGSPDYPANHASKAAVRLMSKTDAMLYAKDKIRVNSVHPGYIWTPLLDEVAKKSPLGYEQYKKQQDKIQPIGHMGDPLDIAYAILYLASDEARFMTASEIVIDGGLYGGREL